MLIRKENKAYFFTLFGMGYHSVVIGVDAYSDAVAIERFYKLWKKHYPPPSIIKRIKSSM